MCLGYKSYGGDMLETYIREPYQRALVNPIAKLLSKKISPNQLTVLSGAIGVLVLPCLYFNAYILAAIMLLASGYLDTLDGTLARVTGKSSDWGSVLDITVDRVVEFVVILSLWLVAPEMRSFWVIMILGSILLCITSFLVVGIFSANQSEKSFYYSPGMMERAEAFVFFIAMMIFPSWFSLLSFMFCMLVVATAIIRLKQFYNAEHLRPLIASTPSYKARHHYD